MTELPHVVSPDDTGSDTFARFKYQAHATFPYILQLIRDDKRTAVVPEHVEDIAVEVAGSWQFLQVKSRDPGRGPWTLSEVIESGAVGSLWRAYRAAQPHSATFGVLLGGALRNGDVLVSRADGKEFDDASLRRLARECGVSPEEIGDFAARLVVRELPPLRFIAAENVREIARMAPALTGGQIEQIYEAALAEIERAMAADRLDSNWPAALFLEPDDRDRLRLRAKRIDRDRAKQIFAPLLRAGTVRSAPFVLPQVDVPTFTGRSEELERLATILLHQGGEKVSSIVGVSGSGGIGKSALACHFAEVHRNAFPDGVIGLRVDGREPVNIARDFARCARVEIDDDDEREASAIMQEIFGERRALLIFDNAEDVGIRALLPGGTRCAVIVTTRNRSLPASLGVLFEAQLDLAPLIPAEAVELLARLVGELAAGDSRAAVEICALVGHLPLAIQIAGATVRTYPWCTLDGYAKDLRQEKERLSLLRVSDDPELDVRASFSLSLRLLDAETVNFFAGLTVCAQDGFSPMSAGAANGCDERTALERLSSLFRLSLLNGAVDGSTRFVLHPLIRLFARELAEERGLFPAADARHRAFYVDLVRHHTGDTAVPESVALLGREIDDIVAAAESMARSGAPDYDFVIRLEPFFQRHGHWEKAASIFTAFLDAAELSNAWSAVVQLRLQQAKFLSLRGKLDDAQDLLVRLETITAQIETDHLRQRAEAMVLNSLGGVWQRQGKFDEAVDAFRRSYDLLMAVGDSRGQAMILNSLGGVLQRQGKFGAAADAFRKSYDLTAVGDSRGQAMILNSLGGVLQRTGDFVAAAEVLQQSALIEAGLGNQRGEAMVLNSLGGVLQRAGDFIGAAKVLQQSALIEAGLGNQRGEAMVLNSLGGVLQRQGKFDEAVDAFRRSYDALIALGDSRGQAMVLNSLGGVLQRKGDFVGAVEALQQSALIEARLGNQRGEAMVLNSLGGVLQRQGKFDEAVDAFRRSYDLLLEMRDRRGQAMVLNSLGGALHRQRKYDEAGDAFRQSIVIGDELGDKRHLAMVHTAYGNALLRTDRQQAVGELRKGFEIDAALKNRKGVGIVAPVLIETLVKLGGIGEAREICDRALTIIPEDARLLALRRELEQRGGST